jgi:hypothetical protein
LETPISADAPPIAADYAEMVREAPGGLEQRDIPDIPDMN